MIDVAKEVGSVCRGASVLLLVLAAAIGCSKSDSTSERTGRAKQTVTTTFTFEVPLPDAMTFGPVALAASSSLKINDRAVVTGRVVNTGSVATDIGVDARTGEVTSIGNVNLRDRARVEGDVTTNGSVTLAGGATVQGQIFDGESTATSIRRFTVDFGNGSGGTVNVAPGQSHTLAPGSYQGVVVSGTLELSAGSYFFSNSFILEPPGQIRLNTAAGPVLIYAHNQVLVRGQFVGLSTTSPAVLLASAGSSVVQIESAFSGVVLAPNATINVATGGPFRGQAFGKSIEVHQDRIWQGRAYGFLERLFEPLPSGGLQIAGTEQLSDLLPNNAIGSAIVDFVTASYTRTTPQQRADTLNALRALPPADVVSALASAFDGTPDFETRWTLVDTARRVEHPTALPFFVGLLDRPVPDLSSRHHHDRTVLRNSKILLRAIAGVERLVGVGVNEARPVLLKAATQHPLRHIRANAVFRIVRMGDAQLLADLDAAISAEDRPFLGMRPMTQADVDGVARPKDPNSPPEAPIPPTSASGGAGGGGPGSGGAGGSGGSACEESVAIDLGPPGNDVTVPNTACLRVRDGYPSWWANRVMKLETTASGSYPAPFTWSNTCSGSSGSGLFTGDWQHQLLSVTSANCATLINLNGAGNGDITVRYWAQ